MAWDERPMRERVGARAHGRMSLEQDWGKEMNMAASW